MQLLLWWGYVCFILRLKRHLLGDGECLSVNWFNFRLWLELIEDGWELDKIWFEGLHPGVALLLLTAWAT